MLSNQAMCMNKKAHKNTEENNNYTTSKKKTKKKNTNLLHFKGKHSTTVLTKPASQPANEERNEKTKLTRMIRVRIGSVSVRCAWT